MANQLTNQLTSALRQLARYNGHDTRLCQVDSAIVTDMVYLNNKSNHTQLEYNIDEVILTKNGIENHLYDIVSDIQLISGMAREILINPCEYRYNLFSLIYLLPSLYLCNKDYNEIYFALAYNDFIVSKVSFDMIDTCLKKIYVDDYGIWLTADKDNLTLEYGEHTTINEKPANFTQLSDKVKLNVIKKVYSLLRTAVNDY